MRTINHKNRLDEIVKNEIQSFVNSIISEDSSNQLPYSVQYEFYNTKTYSPDDKTRGRNGQSQPTDNGYETFQNEEEAYQFFINTMQSHEGEYARVFTLKYNGKPIEDLSKTRIFNGRVKGSDTFEKQWNEYQREVNKNNEPDKWAERLSIWDD